MGLATLERLLNGFTTKLPSNSMLSGGAGRWAPPRRPSKYSLTFAF